MGRRTHRAKTGSMLCPHHRSVLCLGGHLPEWVLGTLDFGHAHSMARGGVDRSANRKAVSNRASLNWWSWSYPEQTCFEVHLCGGLLGRRREAKQSCKQKLRTTTKILLIPLDNIAVTQSRPVENRLSSSVHKKVSQGNRPTRTPWTRHVSCISPLAQYMPVFIEAPQSSENWDQEMATKPKSLYSECRVFPAECTTRVMTSFASANIDVWK